MSNYLPLLRIFIFGIVCTGWLTNATTANETYTYIRDTAICKFVAATNIHSISNIWNCSNWVPSSTICSPTSSWSFIKCSSGEHEVLDFHMKGLSLTGTIPSAIGDISTLTKLEFSDNSLSSSIPTSIGKLTNVKSINFTRNKLIGKIPTSLSSLNELTELRLDDNHFVGPVSSMLLSTTIEILALEKNFFTSTIPSSLCCNSLSYLRIADTWISCYPFCLREIQNFTYGNIERCSTYGNYSCQTNTTMNSTITVTSTTDDNSLTTVIIIVICILSFFFGLAIPMVSIYFCLLKKEKKIHTDKAIPIPTPIPMEMILASKEASHKITTVIVNNILLGDIRNAPGLVLYHGTINTKATSQKHTDVVILVSKYNSDANILKKDYEAHYYLHSLHPEVFLLPLGYVTNPKLSFASGVSSTGCTGIVLAKPLLPLDQYLEGISELLENSLFSKKTLVANCLIDIMVTTLKYDYVLHNLSLDQLVYSENRVKLLCLHRAIVCGDYIYYRNTNPAIMNNGSKSATGSFLQRQASTKSHQNMMITGSIKKRFGFRITMSSGFVATPEHSVWCLGLLLYELFAEISLQESLGINQTLATCKQTEVNNAIDMVMSSSENWFRKHCLLALLKINPAERPLGEGLLSLKQYLEPDEDMILFAMSKGAPADVIINLLMMFPSFASKPTSTGLLPIQYAFQMNLTPSVISCLLQQYPEGVKSKFPNDGKSLIQYAADKSMSNDYISILLPFCMPIDKVTGTPLVDHGFGWTKVLCHENPPDIYVESVKAIVKEYSAHIEVLTNCVDELGRTALNIATPKCKDAILEVLHFLGRYEFKSGMCEHQSATCVVRLATDQVEHKTVALKFMKNKDQFYRELNSRKKGIFSDEYVLDFLASFDGDKNENFKEEMQRKAYLDYNYCLVMIAAERTLLAVTTHEHIAGKDWVQIRLLCTQILQAVLHLHSRGMIHGDIKPLNLMRIQGRFVLIDLDACVSFKDGDYAGAKYSSAYIPPEMIYVDDSNGTLTPYVKTFPVDATGLPVLDGLPYSPVKADPSFDMWSLGVTLFQVCTGQPLFLSNIDDNIDQKPMLRLYQWQDKYKAMKLANVRDPLAHNLLSQLLSKVPIRRPSAKRALKHPFLSGKKTSRLPGEEPEFDVFLSYRVASDSGHVERLYNMLISRNIKVWWDKKCLDPGLPWEDGFCNGLANSRAFVPLLSREAINSTSDPTRRNFANLKEDSPCDNVLLEYRLALEMRALGLLDLVFPVLIGDHVKSVYSDYFSSGCHPVASDVTVKSVEEKVVEHLDKQGLGAPVESITSVSDVLTKLLENQGSKVCGNPKIAFESVVSLIVEMIENSRNKAAMDDDEELLLSSPKKFQFENDARILSNSDSSCNILKGALAEILQENAALKNKLKEDEELKKKIIDLVKAIPNENSSFIINILDILEKSE